MRTAKLTLNGVEYTLCFSARVMRSCAERYGDMNAIYDALNKDKPVEALDEAVWLLAQLIDGGARYSRLNGGDAPSISPDDLYDIAGIDDLTNLPRKIAETISAGQATTVEAHSKNAEATPGK